MEIHIDSKDKQKRVDKKMSEIFSKFQNVSLTRSIIQKYLTNGCKVNGGVPKKSYKLNEGDTLFVDLEYWEKISEDLDLSSEIKAQNGNLDIRYENDDFIVLHKPKGLVVHPGVGNRENTLANYLRYYLESKNEYDSLMDRCGIVHRLDKGVSGLMVVAKNKLTQEYLKGEFAKKNVIKIYHAYLEESNNIEQKIDIREYLKEMSIDLQPWKNWLKVEGYIGRSKSNRYKMEFKKYEFGGSKYALSYILFSGREALIKIDTGRMHQIRVTLAYLGYHIQGDSLYGNGCGDEIMLESVLLSFQKRSGERLIFTI